jgi:hypothetical protein
LGAVPAGEKLIEQYHPEVIWSTYPIATAHLIALRLHRRTGIPLVADFRDPMAQEGYPADPRTHRMFLDIERDLVRDASRLVFVTPSARELYRERYPATPDERFALIENGYDEESFAAAERGLDRTPLNPGCFTLLHSGIVYPSERDPTALFAALGRMRGDGRIRADRFRIRFRAPVHDDLLRRLAEASGSADVVEILPAMPYGEALNEMLRADGLLLMQGANCNEQIPAKLYEYFRARRPILGLADPAATAAGRCSARGWLTLPRSRTPKPSRPRSLPTSDPCDPTHRRQHPSPRWTGCRDGDGHASLPRCSMRSSRPSVQRAPDERPRFGAALAPPPRAEVA